MKKLTVVTTYYNTEDANRNLEMQTALKSLIANPFIKLVIVLTETNELHLLKLKCKVIFVPKRPTVADAYNVGIEHSEFFALVNSDIAFDDTLRYALDMTENSCYALSRYDVNENQTLTPYHKKDSQDAWIFNAPQNVIPMDYYFGVAGSDNRMAYDIWISGVSISNPCLTIKALHYHASDHRPQDRTIKVPKPYHFVNPSAL